MATIKARYDFDWNKVVWSKPKGRIPPLCSYCIGPIGENDVPLIFWKPNGAMAQFCDTCAELFFGVKKFEDPPEDG